MARIKLTGAKLNNLVMEVVRRYSRRGAINESPKPKQTMADYKCEWEHHASIANGQMNIFGDQYTPEQRAASREWLKNHMSPDELAKRAAEQRKARKEKREQEIKDRQHHSFVASGQANLFGEVPTEDEQSKSQDWLDSHPVKRRKKKV